jgi:hypothetical protein
MKSLHLIIVLIPESETLELNNMPLALSRDNPTTAQP